MSATNCFDWKETYRFIDWFPIDRSIWTCYSCFLFVLQLNTTQLWLVIPKEKEGSSFVCHRLISLSWNFSFSNWFLSTGHWTVDKQHLMTPWFPRSVGRPDQIPSQFNSINNVTKRPFFTWPSTPVHYWPPLTTLLQNLFTSVPNKKQKTIGNFLSLGTADSNCFSPCGWKQQQTGSNK